MFPKGTLGWPWGPLAHSPCNGTVPRVDFKTILTPIWGPFGLPLLGPTELLESVNLLSVHFSLALGAPKSAFS